MLYFQISFCNSSTKFIRYSAFPFILMVEISVGCPHVAVNTPVLRNTLFTIYEIFSKALLCFVTFSWSVTRIPVLIKFCILFVLQHDSLPQSNSDQLEKLKIFKTMLERIISFLQVAKTNISLGYKEKLESYEKQIVNFVNTNRPKKPVSSLPQGQLPAPHMQSTQVETKG